jgi:hypothetical protein
LQELPFDPARLGAVVGIFVVGVTVLALVFVAFVVKRVFGGLSRANAARDRLLGEGLPAPAKTPRSWPSKGSAGWRRQRERCPEPRGRRLVRARPSTLPLRRPGFRCWRRWGSSSACWAGSSACRWPF